MVGDPCQKMLLQLRSERENSTRTAIPIYPSAYRDRQMIKSPKRTGYAECNKKIGMMLEGFTEANLCTVWASCEEVLVDEPFWR